jgi:hypothetical protein
LDIDQPSISSMLNVWIFCTNFLYEFFVRIFWQIQNVTRKTMSVQKNSYVNVDEIDTSTAIAAQVNFIGPWYNIFALWQYL